MNDVRLKALKMLNVIFIAIPFAVCWYSYYLSCMDRPFHKWGSLLMIVLFSVLYTRFGKIYDAFIVSVSRISGMVYSQTLSALVSDILMYLTICLISRKFISLLPGMVCLIVQFAVSELWCVLTHRWYFKVFPPKRTAVIYEDREKFESLIDKYNLKNKFDVVLSISTDDCLKDISVLDGIEAVFVNDFGSQERDVILKYCANMKIDVYVLPCIGDIILSGAYHVRWFRLVAYRRLTSS